MMKRTLSMILATLMVVAILCAMPAALAEEDVITLRLWGGVQPEYGYATLVENFNEEFKDQGIQLEYVRYVNDEDGNLQLDTYLMAGGEIDIFMGYGGTGRLFPRIESGVVLDMTPYLEAAGFDPIQELGEAAVAQYIYDDKYYALPTKYENSCYWFANVEMFEALQQLLLDMGFFVDSFGCLDQQLLQVVDIDRLFQIIEYTDPHPFLYVPYLAIATHQDHLYCGPVCKQFPRHFDPAHTRHFNVGDNDVRRLRLKSLQRGRWVAKNTTYAQPERFPLHRQQQHLCVANAVINDKYTFHLPLDLSRQSRRFAVYKNIMMCRGQLHCLSAYPFVRGNTVSSGG